MTIIFGSREAMRIIEKDRNLRRVAAELAKDGMTVEDAEQRLIDIEEEISMLELERYELRRKLAGDW